MFLVRSIRRTLVLLFAIALLLMAVLAGIGTVSLFWHQEAVADLDFLLHRSPDRDHLSRSVARISESLYENYDLSREESVVELRRVYLSEVDHAIHELSEFSSGSTRSRHRPINRCNSVNRSLHDCRRFMMN